jgi:hypothetical protein
MPRVDLAGRIFGRLTVLQYAFSDRGRTYWKCRCECGHEKTIFHGNLTMGVTRSCGCLYQNAARNRWRQIRDSGQSVRFGFFTPPSLHS